jgi:hypothetical protein
MARNAKNKAVAAVVATPLTFLRASFLHHFAIFKYSREMKGFDENEEDVREPAGKHAHSKVLCFCMVKGYGSPVNVPQMTWCEDIGQGWKVSWR